MKILHITFHEGCQKNINFVCQSLGHTVETQKATWNYNIGFDRAKEIWNQYKDYYNQFDAIITSDTAPLSRIFLQNNYDSKLIIWICNRFDYYDASTIDCEFPDNQYYDLMRSTKYKKNVKVFSYTAFEYEYAQKYRNVDFGSNIIKPCAFIEDNTTNSAFSNNLEKSKIFVIPRYHNDMLFMNLAAKCDELGINNFPHHYNGPSDLKDIKGIIHLPYSWSNFSIFEQWSIGNVHFIPSYSYMMNLYLQNNYHIQEAYGVKDGLFSCSEWYLPEHRDLFIYFDSWDHLKQLTIDDNLIMNKKNKCLAFSEQHTNKMLQLWDNAITNWNL
jgi:hypothetical protein